MQKLFPEKGYKDEVLADGETLVAWCSKITSAERVEGLILSDSVVRLELQALRPQSNPARVEQGTVVTTTELDNDDWTTLEDSAAEDPAITADAPWAYSWRTPCREVRLLVHNASGDNATLDLEVNTRNP